MSDDENRVLNYSISEYLDLYYKKHKYNKYNKLAMVITPNQVAYSIGNIKDHWDKTIDLSKTLFPTRNYDHNNLYEDGIWIYSVGEDITIQIPQYSIDAAQYQCLEELINDVLKYESENNVKVFDYNVEEILSQLKRKIISSYESDEVIITKPTIWNDKFLGKEVMNGKPHNLKNVKQYDIANDSYNEEEEIKPDFFHLI